MILLIVIALLLLGIVAWLVLGAAGAALGGSRRTRPLTAKEQARADQFERDQAEFLARRELAKQEAIKRLQEG
jgi:hypothetical protein